MHPSTYIMLQILQITLPNMLKSTCFSTGKMFYATCSITLTQGLKFLFSPTQTCK